jgi:hypothetical protein
MRFDRLLPVTLGVCFQAIVASGADIVVKMPEGMRVDAAEAVAAKTKAETSGKVKAAEVRFADLSSDTPYDVALMLSNGDVLRGVDMSWYSPEPEKAHAEEIADDDKEQINAILKQVLSFYNKNDLLLLRGNHDRAVALVQLVRDKAFHSDQGGEIIWHIELWYFKNQHGGWEKVQQANKILRRERFTSRDAFKQIIDHLRWIPELGGLKIPKDQTELTITLPANVGGNVGATSNPSRTDSVPAAK